MRTLIFIALLVSSAAFAQDYYGDYGRQYNPPARSGNIDDTDRILERQQNFMRNQINQGMRELEIRGQIRNRDLINGGDGYPTGRANGYYRY